MGVAASEAEVSAGTRTEEEDAGRGAGGAGALTDDDTAVEGVEGGAIREESV